MGGSVGNVKLEAFSVSNGGKELIQNGELLLAMGRRYGLVGRNGTGKTTLLRALANKEIKGIPENCQVGFFFRENEAQNDVFRSSMSSRKQEGTKRRSYKRFCNAMSNAQSFFRKKNASFNKSKRFEFYPSSFTKHERSSRMTHPKANV